MPVVEDQDPLDEFPYDPLYVLDQEHGDPEAVHLADEVDRLVQFPADEASRDLG
ncbi:hypothetical protein OHB00_07010 [Streptomyces sp. NBC_00631]|uniref:hypothetical protein n=1 Tax=Streptomyces sp. NBC_00631 TaxID=2975793 RepID=UPI0030DF01AF